MGDSLSEAIGDLATTIGLTRPAGQCFALIWRAAEPPCADDLVARLGLSRSNVSTALKELRTWGLVKARRGPGERRDGYTAPSDPRDLVRIILAARRQMILVPFAERLLEIEAGGDDPRSAALHEIVLKLETWFGQLSRPDTGALAAVFGSRDPAKSRKKNKKKKSD